MTDDTTAKPPRLDTLYELTVAQIDREVALVDMRLRWFLTFNGLVFAAFVLSFRAGATHLVLDVARVIFPLGGIVMSVLVFGALRASENLRDRIKAFWSARDTGGYPPAFSTDQGSLSGRFAARAVPCTIGAMWAALLLALLIG
jgi:hypothetical protein